MKRRIMSLITALALCLSLCPTWALAVGWDPDTNLCSHHRAHTEECGYVPPVSGLDCAHEHDENCFVTKTLCVHQHTEDCYPEPDPDSDFDSEREPSLCAHECSEDNGCVTLSQNCQHVHDEFCGYVPEDAGAPCTYVCRVCPIEDLTGKLPRSVTPDNKSQVENQLNAILALYAGLTGDEQDQLDLSRCSELQAQLNAANAPALIDGDDYAGVGGIDLTANKTISGPYSYGPQEFYIRILECTLTASENPAIIVKSTYKLYLGGNGTVTSQTAAGVEVQTGGTLIVKDPGLSVNGKTYGLDVASGAEVELSGGTFSGEDAAIRVTDGNFAALLKPGYAYFDASGNLIQPTDVGVAKTVVIKQCTNHVYSYTHGRGALTHSWTCKICGAEGSAKCTFDFEENGPGTAVCDCENSISISGGEFDSTDWGYDSTAKPENADVTVLLEDGSNKKLEKDIDYTVEYEPRADVGEITVTVTGSTYNGTFTKTYNVTQAQPTIEWVEPSKAVDYNGSQVKSTDLPDVTITAPNSGSLRANIQYSYRTAGSDTYFTGGLPTNAGTYEIKASIPESQNYKAAETNPCLTLTIDKIPAVITPPTAAQPTYNREAQALVTPGELDSRAAGAVIEYATIENGDYSTTIPTGTNAESYDVWYRVVGTNNYDGDSGKIDKVLIKRKQITPTVELSYYTTLYDGGEKQPAVTVKDGETVIPKSEYTVTYSKNQNVGTATVTVNNDNNKTSGNYTINQTRVDFKITNKTQDALSITKQPDTVTYGDVFTLGTSGGSGNGAVTWKITSTGNVATVDPNSGQVTIKGVGQATVQATKSGKYNNVTNYEDAIATWQFTAAKKAVVATVTAENKTYDTNKSATVHAVVKEGVLPGDEVTIPDAKLSGQFDDETAGTNKTVTVTVENTPSITGENSGNYNVSYSSMTVTADITKATTSVKTAPEKNTLTYDGKEQNLVEEGEANIAGIPLEYALSENGPYSENIPTGKNAGDYKVWYRVKETGNYFGTDAKYVDVTIQRKQVDNPVVTLVPDEFTYDSTAKEPAVTVEETANGPLIDSSEYTVEYSNNINVGTGGTQPTVTVTANADGNYTFTASQTFWITKSPAQVITAPEPAGEPLTYNTREQKLVTAGTASGGTMVYSLAENGTYTDGIPIAKDAKDYTVYYKVEGDSDHGDSAVGSVTVTIAPKVVTGPVIELKNVDGTLIRYTYDGELKEPRPVVKDGSTEIDEKEYDITYFNNKDSGIATVSITAKAGGNYTVTGSTTFVIDKADIKFDTLPAPADITYDGKPHELLTEGTLDGGTVLYSLSKNGIYTDAIPEKTESGTYTVWYKVVGDKNHNDLTAESVDVTIKIPVTSITIKLSPERFDYDGGGHWPTVTVKDGDEEIPAAEYSVTCKNEDNEIFSKDEPPKESGDYTIIISNAPGGNYDLTGVTENQKTFKIEKINQAPLTFKEISSSTNYGDTFKLEVEGGTGDGAVTWSVSPDSPTTVDVDNDGTVTITDVGEVIIAATKAGDKNHNDATKEMTFTASGRPVNATVTVEVKEVDGELSATVLSVTVDDRDLVSSEDEIIIDPTSISATVDTSEDSSEKTVTLDSSKARVSGHNSDKYLITYPKTVPANITEETTPETVETVNGGNTGNTGNGGTSTNTTNIPTNSTLMTSGLNTVSALTQASVRNGTATAVLNAADGSELVKEAVANQSKNVIIKPEITGDVTKTEVSIPASTVSQLKSQTNADLTISTPAADVTIPNAALDTLSSAGGAIKAVTEQNDNAVTLTLTADGKTIESVPGGVTLTVPVEDAGPGTVAVLVHDDGTSETIRKSVLVYDSETPGLARRAVMKSGKLNIPLNGSATVQIVDNSKDFTDVPDGNWAADAVAFASAHELFNGTSETTFSPDQSMNRGMLTTVLYNLEGQPAQSLTSEFSDVSSDTWYAPGISWATENGIAHGYSDGQFAPNQSITREQLAVMLWRYAGSPSADDQTLDFTDADKVSSYAMEALSWAVANGILNGYGDGQLNPSGLATRAQAAQMLKNFMENT